MRASPIVQPRSPDVAISAPSGHHSSTAPLGNPSNAAPIASRPSLICAPPANDTASVAAYDTNADLAPCATDSAANAESARRSSVGSARPRTKAPGSPRRAGGENESGTATGVVRAYAMIRQPAALLRQHARYLPRPPLERVPPYV